MEFLSCFIFSIVRAEALARMIRSFFEKGERAIEQQFLRLRPQHAGPIDRAPHLGAKAVLGLRHRRPGEWRAARRDRALRQRNPAKARRISPALSKRRLEFAKTVQRIAKALARDAKIVKPQLIAPLQAAGKPPNFAQASM